MISICKNCRFHEKVSRYGGVPFHHCLHPFLRKTDIVTGEKVATGSLNCYDVRANKDKCGLTGKWYESKSGFKFGGTILHE